MINYDKSYYEKQLKEDHSIDYFFPKSDSPLFVKKGVEYLRRLDAKDVPFLTQTEVNECQYSMQKPDSITEKILFAALMNTYVSVGRTSFEDFSQYIGFDMDCLPDATYLMHLLYRIDPKSPMFATQSKKGVYSSTEKKAILASIMGKQNVTHSSVKAVSQLYKSEMQEIAQAYEYTKFKMEEFKGMGKQIMAYANKNNSVGKIINSFVKKEDLVMLPKNKISVSDLEDIMLNAQYEESKHVAFQKKNSNDDMIKED